MAQQLPPPLTVAERRARQRRAARIARGFGFVGRVEYRHVYSSAGGAQYGLATTAEQDMLIVYAEAFDRDADPDDFSLEAILAHERGHQLLARHPRLAGMVADKVSAASEEILASILGALLCSTREDRDNLLAKATVELLERGEQSDHATRLIERLTDYLEKFL